MSPAPIELAGPGIESAMDAMPSKVYRFAELANLLDEHRGDWHLADGITVNEFIDFLCTMSHLSRVDFPFPSRKEIRYTWRSVPLLEVAMTLKPNCYFCHYTAVRMHGLTEQNPRVYYVNHEQERKPWQAASLTQESISRAFEGSPRRSNNIADVGSFRFCLLNGMASDLAGVEPFVVPDLDGRQDASVRMTNIERTLVDVAVRPFYAGGLNEVLKAYRLAHGRVSPPRVADMLAAIGYLYPYAQSIGYLFERSGPYSDNDLRPFRETKMEYDFYLGHRMGPTEYVPQWRLFVPKGF